MSASPIRTFHRDWHRMSIPLKLRYLIDTRQAKDRCEAGSLLARHRVACSARRKLRQSSRRNRNAACDAEAQKIVGAMESVSVTGTCGKCEAACFMLTQFADAHREKKEIIPFGTVGRNIFCLACIEVMKAEGLIVERTEA